MRPVAGRNPVGFAAARGSRRARDRWLLPRWHERVWDQVLDRYEGTAEPHQEVWLFFAVSVPGVSVVAVLYLAALGVAR